MGQFYVGTETGVILHGSKLTLTTLGYKDLKPWPDYLQQEPDGYHYEIHNGSFSLVENETYVPEDPKTQKNLTMEERITAKILAVSDRQDFLEDCIAEMATQVYS